MALRGSGSDTELAKLVGEVVVDGRRRTKKLPEALCGQKPCLRRSHHRHRRAAPRDLDLLSGRDPIEKIREVASALGCAHATHERDSIR